ncbi:MAG TPA: OsmC family protein [bacterium]
MGNEQSAITVKLINKKLQFTGTAGSNAPVTIDYVPPLGDGQCYMSLELLLISLASCCGSTVASLLRRMKKDVSGMVIEAQGVRRDQHPTSFRKIMLEFVINSQDAVDADVQSAIKLSEDTFCPVWAMLKNNVEVATEFKIITG